MSPYKILCACFAALPKKNRDRLAEHHRRGTKILCGAQAFDFALDGGG